MKSLIAPSQRPKQIKSIIVADWSLVEPNHLFWAGAAPNILPHPDPHLLLCVFCLLSRHCFLAFVFHRNLVHYSSFVLRYFASWSRRIGLFDSRGWDWPYHAWIGYAVSDWRSIASCCSWRAGYGRPKQAGQWRCQPAIWPLIRCDPIRWGEET